MTAAALARLTITADAPTAAPEIRTRAKLDYIVKAKTMPKACQNGRRSAEARKQDSKTR